MHAAAYDSASFAAGQDFETRVAACVARLAALGLIVDSHWWNRWMHRLMARALIAYAEELESAPAAQERCASSRPRSTLPKAVLHSI